MGFYNMLKCCVPNIVYGLNLNDIIRKKILNEYKDLDLLTYTQRETDWLEEYLYNSHIIDRGNIIEYELGQLLNCSKLEGFLNLNPFIIGSYQLAVNGLMRLAEKMKITLSNDFIDKWENDPLFITYAEDLHTASTDDPKEKLLKLPVELDTDRARKYIKKAIENGLIEVVNDELSWTITKKGGKVRLAYFLFRVYCQDCNNKDNNLSFPETALNTLFRESRLGHSLSQIANNKKQGYPEIDRLFE